MAEELDIAEQAEIEPQGDEGNGRVASGSDILVVPSARKQDLAHEFLNFPDTFSESAGRTRLTEKDIARRTRILARYNRFHKGRTDLWQVLHAKDAWRVSLNGEGRAEAERVVVAERRHMFGRGMMGRMRSMFNRGDNDGAVE